jgi:uncharacterized RDD family membrane protein YckC
LPIAIPFIFLIYIGLVALLINSFFDLSFYNNIFIKTTPMDTVPQDVLASEFELNLVQAGTGKRFVNYLIDLIVFYVLCFIIVLMAAAANPESIQSLDQEGDAGSSLALNLLFILLFVLYITFMEGFCKGRTIGKMITGTKAVNEADGSNVSLKTALLRTLCRLVPFEPFSAFGTPWHDSWTKTLVIDVRQSQL